MGKKWYASLLLLSLLVHVIIIFPYSCDHRCGYEFCYNCGAVWKDKKATCSCPLWVEDNIWLEDRRAEEDEDDEDDDYLSDDDFFY